MRLKVILVSSVVLIAIAVVVWNSWYTSDDPRPVTVVTAEPNSSNDKSLESAKIGTSPRFNFIPSDIKQKYEHSTDHKALYDALIESAYENDAESAFYVYKILDDCHLMIMGFEEGIDNKDEWLMNANHHPDEYREKIGKTYDKCQGFFSANSDRSMVDYYGEKRKIYNYWLELAANNNQPVAQVIYAINLVNNRSYKSESQVANLLLESTLSGHPDALYYIANLQSDPIEYAAWSLLTCRHGLDCGVESPWRSRLCDRSAKCARGEDVSDVIRVDIGVYNFNKARIRADNLEIALQAGDKERLGLGFDWIQATLLGNK